MKRLYLVAILAVGLVLLTVAGSVARTSADLAVCPNRGVIGSCYYPAPAQRCYTDGGFANCLTGSRFSAWELYLMNAGIETVVATAFVLLLKKSKRLIAAVVIVNLISWPLFYESVQHIQTGGAVVIGEIVVWLFEAAGIYWICTWRTTRAQALLLSTLTNASTIAASFLLLRQ